MEQIKVNVENGVKTLEILEGHALPQREPVKVDISGTIIAPLRWLEKRFTEIDQKKCHVLVDYDKKSIALKINENDYFSTIIIGKLQLSPDFERFGINSGKYRTPIEMGEFIKMNRAFFENRQQAMELVTQLRSFKAKVDKQVEVDVNLNKGDKKVLVAQAVDSNVPDKFNVKLPIFKGHDPEVVEVETYFNPDDLTCTLVSPAANESIEDTKHAIMSGVINDIISLCPEIAIIEQ